MSESTFDDRRCCHTWGTDGDGIIRCTQCDARYGAWKRNPPDSEVARLGRRVAELEAERDVFRERIGSLAHIVKVNHEESHATICAMQEERDAAQRDAATLRGALEWAVLDADQTAEEFAHFHGRPAPRVPWVEAAKRALAPAPAQATSEEGK